MDGQHRRNQLQRQTGSHQRRTLHNSGVACGHKLYRHDRNQRNHLLLRGHGSQRQRRKRKFQSGIGDAQCDSSARSPHNPGTSSCATPISAVNTAGNTNVVGDGTPASCTESAFEEAIAAGGVVTFNCGPSPYRLVLSSTKSITQDTVIDGGNLVTLDGGGQVRQLLLNNGNFDATTPTLTLQNITLANGHGTDNAGTGAPTGGGAIYRYGGTLNVINSQFINNVGPASGQDSAGGAIYSVGVGTTTVVGSTFNGNQSSDGGALGNLGASVDLVNDTIQGNQATGTGGNPGNGGNGGGVYMDGANISDQNVWHSC